MPNRFNTLFESTPYVSQYVPLPLGLIQQEGANKQKQHDDTINDISKAQDILKVESDPNREPIKNQLISRYNSSLSSLADEYMKNDNPTQAARKLYDLKRSWANDPTRLILESSKSNYDEYLKEKRKLIQDGKLDPSIKGGYDTYSEDRVFDENGKLTPFIHQGMLTSENLDAKSKEMMGTIAHDGKDFEGDKFDKQGNLITNGDGSYWSIRSGGEGVGKSKAASLAIEKSDQFISDNKEGRYFIDKTLGHHVPYANLTHEEYDRVQKSAAKYLYDSAAQQIGWKSKSGQSIKFLPEDIRSAKQSLDAPVITNNTQVESMTTKDFEKQLGNIKDTKNQIIDITNKMNGVSKDSREYATYKYQLDDLNNKKSSLENNQKILDESLKASKYTQEPIINELLTFPTSNKDVSQYREKLIEKLDGLSANEKTTNLSMLLDEYKYGNKSEERTSSIMTKILKEANLTKMPKMILNLTKDEVQKKVNEQDYSEFKGVLGKIRDISVMGGDVTNPFSFAAYKISQLRNDFIEDNNKISLGTSTLVPDPKASGKEKTVLNRISNAYKDDLQHNTNYQNFAGNSLNELVNDQSFVNGKGDKTKLDPTQADPILTYKPINGKFYMNVVFKDAYDANGAPVSKLLAPENQTEYKSKLRQIGNELLSSDDSGNKQKGFEVLSNVEYGSDLSIANSKLMSEGQQVPVTLHTSHGEVKAVIVKNKESISILDSKGNKMSLHLPGQTDSDPVNTFGGTEELAQSLYTTWNKKSN